LIAAPLFVHDRIAAVPTARLCWIPACAGMTRVGGDNTREAGLTKAMGEDTAQLSD
jgi:hypothetical protein